MATSSKIKLRRERMISLTDWLERQTDVSDDDNEPSTLIERQTTELARQLRCTETMAQKILFGQIPHPDSI